VGRSRHPALSKAIIHSLRSDPSIPFQTQSDFFREGSTLKENTPAPKTPHTRSYNLTTRHPNHATAMPPHQQTHLRGAGSATQPATHGSQTILQTNAGPSGTLRLRAEPQERRGIRWAEDVVDNEGMGKKSSKVCCIYHAPHEPGDSDSDSSSSSDSDSDNEPDLSRARKAGGRGRKGKHDGHDHGHGEGDGDCSGKGNGKGKERKPSPNAYERQPKLKSKKAG
jgi:protein phosphatase 1 regulatory subunit 11